MAPDRPFRRRSVLVFLLMLVGGGNAPAAAPRTAENVLVVTLDGFRWQELFGGADESLLDTRQGGVKDLPGLKRRYWREAVADRREALMPFFWGTIAKQGQVFGNRERKASARSTNG